MLQDASERANYGRNRRRILKRSDHDKWDPGRRSYDPIDVILASETGRIPELIPVKMARMAASPFCFFRGSVPLMAADLATLPTTKVHVQICGDAHVHNLGAFAAPDDRLVFDINDFDETIPGPWEWDVKRLATSLVLAGREANNSDRVCREAVAGFVKSYRTKMMEFSAMPHVEVARYHIHRQFSGRAGKSALQKAEKATPLHNLDKLTEAQRKKPHIFKESKPVLTRVSRIKGKHVLSSLRFYREVLSPDARRVLDFYRPVDVAFKVVGTGSVATHDYVVLLFGGCGPQDPLFLQIKEEPKSSYAPYVDARENQTHQGKRVAQGQRLMQVQSDILLGWTTLEGRHYLVRQLSDHKGTIEDEDLKGNGLGEYAQLTGEVLARAHARSGDPCILAGYLGAKRRFDKAILRFAISYADQTAKDHEVFQKAIRRGKIKASHPYL